MIKKLPLLVLCVLICQPFCLFAQDADEQSLIPPMKDGAIKFNKQPCLGLKKLLRQEGMISNHGVINKVFTVLSCANQYHVNYNNIVTIIDYSLPASKKRLWVFDLNEKKLLFHTYVSHGIKSGALISDYFSNKYNSKTSSIGVYKTEKPYYGRHGISLKLEGLDRGFNDNAANRAIVMHGGWYTDPDFIEKYGRAGRSWGCPAVPENLIKPIINTIKDQSLLVIYYPSDHWFLKSKFLTCHHDVRRLASIAESISEHLSPDEQRDAILFVDYNNNNKHEENEPIATLPAYRYERIFRITAPLDRMLRRQINQEEYIALTASELNSMISYQDDLNNIDFVIPEIKMQHGYYATEMKILNLGKIKQIEQNLKSVDTTALTKSYSVYFEKRKLSTLRATNRFIRWLGL